MKTRLDMFKLVNSNDFESSLKRHFDQIMGLYWLIHEYDFKSIDDNGSTELSIKFKTAKDSKLAFSNIPNSMHIYGKNFTISKTLEKNKVYIEMQEFII